MLEVSKVAALGVGSSVEFEFTESADRPFDFEVDPSTEYLTVSLRTDEPNLGTRLALQNAVGEMFSDPIVSDQIFVDEARSLFVIRSPHAGRWRIAVQNIENNHFFVSVYMVGDEDIAVIASGRPPSARSCWWCKAVFYSLALAIVLALLSGAAAIGAVAAVLAKLAGWQVFVATTFIQGMVGRTVDEVAAAICIAIGRCPR